MSGIDKFGSEPFVFRMTEDKLRECRDMTVEEKLRWLMEANAFVRTFLSPEQRARWARLQQAGCRAPMAPSE